jgi:hypothetical protein
LVNVLELPSEDVAIARTRLLDLASLSNVPDDLGGSLTVCESARHAANDERQTLLVATLELERSVFGLD